MIRWSYHGEITGPIDWEMGAFVFGLRLAGIRTTFCCAGHPGKRGRPYIAFLTHTPWMIRLVIQTARAYGWETVEVCTIPPEPEWGWDIERTALYFERRGRVR